MNPGVSRLDQESTTKKQMQNFEPILGSRVFVLSINFIFFVINMFSNKTINKLKNRSVVRALFNVSKYISQSGHPWSGLLKNRLLFLYYKYGTEKVYKWKVFTY